MIFVSDLDNTLIHSYKSAVYGDVCVEVKDGKKLSFMSPQAYGMLTAVDKKCLFIPMTTRSLEQYRRIDLGVMPKYAVVAHGALLLVDGKIDEQWEAETRRLVSVKLPQLTESNVIYDIRYVDDFFVFAKSDSPQLAVMHLQTSIDCDEFVVCAVHNKVYVFPRKLDKGVALERLKRRLDCDKVICAGDSVLDIPMLKAADTAIFPNTLNLDLENSHCLAVDSFAFNMLRIVLHGVKGLSVNK